MEERGRRSVVATRFLAPGKSDESLRGGRTRRVACTALQGVGIEGEATHRRRIGDEDPRQSERRIESKRPFEVALRRGPAEILPVFET